MYIDYKHRIFGLDVVRALAIILVLISHSTLLLFPNSSNFILTIIQFFGAIGVDLFFVLSGYLIGWIILKQIAAEKTRPLDFVYFWIRRWFRTLPNYVLILFLNIGVFYALYDVIIDDISHYFIFVQNFSSAHPDFFTEAWSLSIEEYAYIVVPLLLLLLLSVFKKTDRIKLFLWVTGSLILLVTCFRFNYHSGNSTYILYHDYEWSKEIRKVVIYRLDSIYYGFFAAFLAFKYNRIWQRFKILAFCIGILLFFGIHGVIFSNRLRPEDGLLFFDVFYLPLVSICLLLLFPVFSGWKEGEFLRRTITSISILSYALYLVNYSLILLTIQHFINVEAQSTIIKSLILLAYWVASFFFSYLLYKYFEKPMMNLRDSKFVKHYFVK